MPIVVNCPGCPTKLSAPDTAAGKQIRCPKCGATAPVPTFVPAEEVPVVDAKPVPKPKPKRAVADDDDDDDRPRKKAKSRRDDDDEDDRPRKKKRRADDDDDYPHDYARRRPRAKSGGGGKVALIVGGVLLLLVLVGLGVYFLTGKDSPFAKKAPVPPGWSQYSYDGFRAYFPSQPQVMTMNAGFPVGGRGGGGFFGANDVPEAESVAMYTCGNDIFNGPTPGGVSITVSVTRFRNGVPRNLRDDLNRGGTGKFGNIESRRVRWLGSDASEIVMGNAVVRVAYTDKALIVAQINGPNGTRATPEQEAGFFDNFELTGK